MLTVRSIVSVIKGFQVVTIFETKPYVVSKFYTVQENVPGTHDLLNTAYIYIGNKSLGWDDVRDKPNKDQ